MSSIVNTVENYVSNIITDVRALRRSEGSSEIKSILLASLIARIGGVVLAALALTALFHSLVAFSVFSILFFLVAFAAGHDLVVWGDNTRPIPQQFDTATSVSEVLKAARTVVTASASEIGSLWSGTLPELTGTWLLAPAYRLYQKAMQ